MRDQWIEVFKAGTQTDSKGRTKTWTEDELDQIVAATRAHFGVSGLEAPAVIGHPTMEAPAYGWVSDIKRAGAVLFVKFRDLVPEFVDAVRRRMFPNRSVAINPDYSLNHIGFLGATAPAVKGLAPITLSQDDNTAVITFTTTTQEEDSMADKTFLDKIREFLGLANELGAEVVLPGVTKPAAAAAGTFSQADLDAARAEGIAAAKKEGATALETERRTQAFAQRKTEIAAFCDGLKAKGQLVPAWEAAGLRTFLEALAKDEAVITFAEGDAGKKTPLAFMQEFLTNLPKVVTFSEIATPEDKKPVVLTEAQRQVHAQLGISADDVKKFATA
jgi:hypothetical protein